MKKKKQKPPSSSSSAAAAAAADLQSIIHSHGEFLDHLIELIPARFYLSTDDPDSKPWYQGLSKSAKASLKQQSKHNLKLARRHRFDPDADPSSTLRLLHLQQTEARLDPIDTEERKVESVTYEELQEKLKRKIATLKGNRGESRKVYERNKRKRSDGGDENENEDEEIIEYGKVRLGDENEDESKHRAKKKKKLSKAMELEVARKKQEVRKGNPSVAERESWNAAASRAMGVKVHDDARLIKESMRKERRRKEKNAEKWKERVETQEKMKEERQRKRKDNIVGRINEKKARRIAKREKKLMRPGFEGRKEGFITKE